MKAKAARIVFTVAARKDLQELWRRRRAQRGTEGEDGADALLDRLVARAQSLQCNPSRGPVCPELATLGFDAFRQLSDPPFRLIYRVDSEEAVVTIMVVVDARRDLATLLRERLLRVEHR